MQLRNHDSEVDEDLTQLVRVGGRCSYVLLLLLSVILLYPYVIEWAWGRTVMAVLVSAVVLAIACAVGRSRQRLLAVSIFAVALLGLRHRERSIERRRALIGVVRIDDERFRKLARRAGELIQHEYTTVHSL